MGVDINRKVLDIAKSRLTSVSSIEYYLSTDQNIRTAGPYSMIFAMSVFCRWPDSRELENISALYSFETFGSGLILLDDTLRVGGFLVIANSNFDFLDISFASRYEAASVDVMTSGYVKRFNRANKATGAPAPASCIFRKMA